MATSNYIAAAKKSNRQSTILMSVEDSAASEEKYTTQADWEGSVLLTNMNTVTYPGNIFPFKELTMSSSGGTVFVSFTTTIDTYLGPINLPQTQVTGFPQSGTDTRTGDCTLKIRSVSTVGTVLGETGPVSRTHYAGYAALGFGPFVSIENTAVEFTSDVKVSPGTTYYLEFTYSPTDGKGSVAEDMPDFIFTSFFSGVSARRDIPTTPEDSVNGVVTTSTIDMGSIPSSPPIFSTDETSGTGTTIVYTGLGGNADPPINPLGTISDGDALTAYQYYRITVNFTATSSIPGVVHELAITEGLFRYYGTHQDVPFSGVFPYIIKKSLSSLTQKINLNKGLSNTAQVSINLAWVAEISDMLATGYLKGKDVQISAGFVGLDSVDYEPVITGTWYDSTLDENKGEITVQVQDALKQFDKRKLPTEIYDANGAKTSSTIPYSNSNLIDTITDIYDKIGIRGRYIDTAAYDALKAGALSGNDYRCTRTIDKPVKANDLLDELAQTGGLFLVPTGDGKIKPKLYDPTESALYTLDANELTASSIASNQKELATRSYHYFNPTVAEPSKSDDYGKALYTFNSEAETLYDPEKGEKQWFDKWEIGSNAGADLATPPQALIDMAGRWNGWFSEPRHSFSFTKVPPRWADIEPGDVVAVNNLSLPVPKALYDVGTTYALGDKVISDEAVFTSLAAGNLGNATTDITKWRYEFIGGGKADLKKYIISSRKFDASQATIDLGLIELPVQNGGVPTYDWRLFWILEGGAWNDEWFWLDDKQWEDS